MPIRVALQHLTHYDYDRMVFLSPHLIRLKPAAHTLASVVSYELTIQPPNHLLHWQQDPFGNFMARVDFDGGMNSMSIKVDMSVVLKPINPFDFFLDTYAAYFPFLYEPTLRKALLPYLETSEPGPYMQHWLQGINQKKQGIISFLLELNQQIYQTVRYSVRMQPGVLSPEETLTQKVGSCRDSSWLLVQILRHLGLAARFVSGYLIQLAVGTSANSLAAVEPQEDSLALHAWAEVYIPGAGWLGLDPTSGMLITEGHIPLACTPEPIMAAPVSGTAGQSTSTLTYASTLIRLND